jgi:hypothetical protein
MKAFTSSALQLRVRTDDRARVYADRLLAIMAKYVRRMVRP